MDHRADHHRRRGRITDERRPASGHPGGVSVKKQLARWGHGPDFVYNSAPAAILKEVDMRTRLATVVVITAALSACATAPRVQGVEPPVAPPLRVWIGYPIGRGQVYPIFTNRPAHVAMFEI